MVYTISTIVHNDVSSFPDDEKTCKNHGLFERTVRGDAYIRPGDFGHEHSANYLKFVLHKIMCLPFMYCPQLKFLRRQYRKQI